MSNHETVPYYSADKPFEAVYRNSSTPLPVKPHTHNALEIFFTLTDLPDVLLNDTVSSVPRNSLILIPPHCIHQLFNRKLTVYERYIVTLSSDWFSHITDTGSELIRYAISGCTPLIIRLSPAQADRLTCLLNSFITQYKTLSLEAYSGFFKILAVLDELTGAQILHPSGENLSISNSQRIVNSIIAYINLHLTGPLSLEDISHEFHLNKDYLGRLFKEHTHATVGHYIAVQRVSLAQDMLSHGHTVTEVQESLGFTSYAYFFKFFKKMTGMSPCIYRKKPGSNHV